MDVASEEASRLEAERYAIRNLPRAYVVPGAMNALRTGNYSPEVAAAWVEKLSKWISGELRPYQLASKDAGEAVVCLVLLAEAAPHPDILHTIFRNKQGAPTNGVRNIQKIAAVQQEAGHTAMAEFTRNVLSYIKGDHIPSLAVEARGILGEGYISPPPIPEIQLPQKEPESIKELRGLIKRVMSAAAAAAGSTRPENTEAFHAALDGNFGKIIQRANEWQSEPAELEKALLVKEVLPFCNLCIRLMAGDTGKDLLGDKSETYMPQIVETYAALFPLAHKYQTHLSRIDEKKYGQGKFLAELAGLNNTTFPEIIQQLERMDVGTRTRYLLEQLPRVKNLRVRMNKQAGSRNIGEGLPCESELKPLPEACKALVRAYGAWLPTAKRGEQQNVESWPQHLQEMWDAVKKSARNNSEIARGALSVAIRGSSMTKNERMVLTNTTEHSLRSRTR